MLVLTRNVNESIFIGKDAKVKVKILSVQGGQIKLGIEAERNIPVHREEIYKQVCESLTRKQ